MMVAEAPIHSHFGNKTEFYNKQIQVRKNETKKADSQE